MAVYPEVRVREFKGSGGLPLAADVCGEPMAPPVVLLHGGGQTRHSWGTAMRELAAQGYYVINLDARGHGDSGWAPDGDYSFAAMVQDLACVIGMLASPPALVGASMGGATALTLVGTSPMSAATALVLVDIVPTVNPEGAKKIQAFMSGNVHGFATLEEAADAVSAYNPHRPRPKDVSGLMKNLRRREDGRLYWHWDPALLKQRDRTEPPVIREHMLRAATGIRLPILLVRGGRSDIVTEVGAEELKQHIPQLEVCNVQSAGHMVAGDKNDAFNRAVFEFLHRHHAVPEM
jgi:pimeloyl-ACP methyl ester carboxylesterase